jgi:hypothetical protein
MRGGRDKFYFGRWFIYRLEFVSSHRLFPTNAMSRPRQIGRTKHIAYNLVIVHCLERLNDGLHPPWRRFTCCRCLRLQHDMLRRYRDAHSIPALVALPNDIQTGRGGIVKGDGPVERGPVDTAAWRCGRPGGFIRLRRSFRRSR